MSRVAKTTLILAGLLGIGLAAAFAGGSLFSFLINGSSLDINGHAKVVADADVTSGWNHYGGDAGGTRYSSIKQINNSNVQKLETAWRYSTGDLTKRSDLIPYSASEATPILVDDKLVFCTPFNEIIALDPGTGKEKWRYDPKLSEKLEPANLFVCRGVAAYSREDDGKTCPTRILMGTNDARLIAVDAETGRPCEDFGDGGQIKIDIGKKELWPGEFQITSPPVIGNGTIIVGSSVSDNERIDAPKGFVRAYDAVTGEPKWHFDPIPKTHSIEAEENWKGSFPPQEGGANVWAPMSIDQERGLVFLPTSSPSPDYFGGNRSGDNRHADSIVALELETGTLVWSFQTVHHNVWDYDVPAQPGLYKIHTASGPQDVVAVPTKTGFVFVLDRETGKPVFPVTEVAVPQRAEKGENLSPTQPMPKAPKPVVPSALSAKDAFGLTWFDRRECEEKINSLWSEGLFSAPTTQGTLLYPFSGGGANWGSSAYDPARNLMIVNMSNLAQIMRLISSKEADRLLETRPDIMVGKQIGAPHAIAREVLMSSLGLPCSPPPWGVIAGIDLAKGKIVWRKTLGTAEDFAGVPIKLGTPNFGGPIVTAGGLVFIGAAMDNYLRAFNVETGQELWKGRLPAGGQATPMTYEWQGRQHVVIFAGGHGRVGTTIGDQLVAFALPSQRQNDLPY